MLNFFLIVLILIFIIYRLLPLLIRWFIARKTNQFSKNMNANRGSNRKNTPNYEPKNSEKIFQKDEGEYVSFEEIKDDK